MKKLVTFSLAITMAACSAQQGDAASSTQQAAMLGGALGSGPSAPAAAAIDDCDVEAGYEVTTFASGVAGSAQVHVLGVYETRSDHGQEHPTGAGTVHVEAPGHHIVVLSAYEPTYFRVIASPGAIVDRVVLYGYYRHDAEVPAGAALDNRSGDEPAIACGYAFPDDGQGCETNALLADVGQTIGKVTSFAGCYHATSMAIRSAATPAPPPAPSEPSCADRVK